MEFQLELYPHQTVEFVKDHVILLDLAILKQEDCSKLAARPHEDIQDKPKGN